MSVPPGSEWQARLLARRAARLSVAQPSGEPAGTISFGPGDGFPPLFPDMTEAAVRALTQYRAETLQYGPRTGLHELRQWICDHIARAEGFRPTPDEVLVVNGAKQGIDLVCRLLLDEQDAVVVTAPTYHTGLPIFSSYGVEFVEVGQDRDGMDVELLRDVLDRREREGSPRPKLVYYVPDFHNPTGVTATEERRRALVRLAGQRGMIILEDSPYRQIRFEGAPQPSLKSLDSDGVVFPVSTCAKLLVPGVHLGWVLAPAPMIERMAQLKPDGGSSPLVQRMVLEFCKAGLLEAHNENARNTYRAHRDRMVAALRRELPEAEFSVPQGGYFLWLRLQPHVDGDEVAASAREAGVIVLPGSRCFAPDHAGHPSNKSIPKNYLRLAYSYASPAEIDEGVRRLAAAFKAATAR